MAENENYVLAPGGVPAQLGEDADRWKAFFAEEINTEGITTLQREKAYAEGNVAHHAGLQSQFYLVCTKAGTTSSNLLDVSSATLGASLPDGTVTWKVAQICDINSLPAAAKSGSYNDLKDKPTIPTNMTAATANAAGKAGLVPAPAAGAQGKYLRGDGTWQTPTNTTYSAATQSANGLMSADDKKKLDGIAAGANAYSHPTSSGNKHIPSGGSSGQILRWSADGTAAWGADNNTTYSNMTAATASAAGKAGLVPAPAAGAQGKFLRGDGTWQTPTDTNTWRGIQNNLTSDSTTDSLSAAQGKVLKGLVDGKAASSHSHNYAGSSSAGGAATSANKLNTNAGNASTPVYFSNGVPVACTGGGSVGAYITESNYNSDGSWYRKWSDGFIEQGGSKISKTGFTTITLIKPFTTTTYTVLANDYYPGNNWSGGCSNIQKTTTTFSIYLSYGKGEWYACGK